MSRESRRIPLLILAAALAGLTASTPAGAQQTPRPPVLRIGSLDGSSINLERPPEFVSVSEDTVPAPADSLWVDLPKIYHDLGVEDVGQDPSQWTFGNAGFTIRRRLGGKRLSHYLRCGSTMTGSVADQYDVHMSILTQLQPLPSGSTLVRSSLQATAIPRSHSGNTVECSTTGKLEESIAKSLALEAAGL